MGVCRVAVDDGSRIIFEWRMILHLSAGLMYTFSIIKYWRPHDKAKECDFPIMDSSGEIVDEELDFHLQPTEDEFRR